MPESTTTIAAEMLSDYIQIPSESGNEKEAGQFLIDKCLQKGLNIQTISDSSGSLNFAASIYPLDLKKPNIIFLNHIDAVQAKNVSDWTYPPYQGKITDNKVWGRGSFDNKGLAITQLSAIEKFIQQARNYDLPYNITLLCVSDEETGGLNGSAIVAKRFNESFTPAVVIGEGGSGVENIKFFPSHKTFFGISVAEKGFLWLKLSCRINTDGHASVVGNDYAIKRLVTGLYKLSNKRQPIRMSAETHKMFKSIGENFGGLKGFAIKHINWYVFRPFLRHQVKENPELESILCNKITISNLKENNTSTNQNAQEAIAMLDCRYLPESSPDEIVATVKKRLNDSIIHISIVRKGPLQYSTTPEFFFDELKNAIKRTFKSAEVSPVMFPASNDNSYYRAAGCPVYGLNPMIVSSGQIKAIHNANEYIDLDDIENGINVFTNFLQSVQKSYTPTDSVSTIIQQ
ncbi:MAG: M20/M25/M40 family metallo-hydrolase [Prolixibacteraceae bacterium]|nr:M20/M25/M40 family metallo-hydrolase [Prolixibacteraceae bacterium]